MGCDSDSGLNMETFIVVVFVVWIDGWDGRLLVMMYRLQTRYVGIRFREDIAHICFIMIVCLSDWRKVVWGGSVASSR
jgi:hypothetical protein